MTEGDAYTEKHKPKHGLSPRLAARVSLLGKLGLTLSPALLAEAGRRKDIGEFLLGPDVAEEAELGRWDELAARAEEVAPLLLLKRSTGPVLVLQTEFDSAAVPSASPPALRKASPMVADLFDDNLPKALRETLLLLLTSPDPSRRLEALRRLLLENRDPGLQSTVLFYALRDPDRVVAAEAVKAMKDLGLSAEGADLLVELIHVPAERADEVVRRLSAALPRFGLLDSTVLLGFLVRLLRDEAFAPHKGALLGLFRDLLARSPEVTRDIPALVALLIRHIPPDHAQARHQGRELLLTLAEMDPRTVIKALWKALESTPSPEMGTFITDALTRLPLPAIQCKRLDQVILDAEIPIHLDRGEDRPLFLPYMIRRWKTLVPALLKRAGAEAEERKAMLVKMAGEVLAKAHGSPRTLAVLLDHCLTLARSSPTAVRRALLRSGLHTRAALPMKIRTSLAGLYITTLEDEFFPQYNVEVYLSLFGIGYPSVDPILDFVGQEMQDIRLRAELVELLGRMLDRADLLREARPRSVGAAIRRIEELGRRPDLAVANRVAGLLGRMLDAPAVKPRTASAAATRCAKRLRKKHPTPGDVAAAASVAASTQVSRSRKSEIARLLLRILERDTSEKVATEGQDEEGTVLTAEPAAEIHMILIPAALDGLRCIARAVDGDPALHYLIARFLMRRYAATESMEIVWSLGNRKRILKTLADLLWGAETPEELRGEVFLFFANLFWKDPSDVVLAQILAPALRHARIPGAEEACARMGRKLLERALRAEHLTPAEREPYLLAAVDIYVGPNQAAPPREETSALVDFLETRIEAESEPALEALELLEASGHLPPDLQERVRRIRAREEDR
jgi:hypothetical protein